LAAVCDRIGQRRAVIDDLFAGRVSGPEAHARFLALNEADPRTLLYVRALFPGATDDERAARQVAWYVRESGHPRAAAVGSALDRELLAGRDSPGSPDGPGRLRHE
jgi:hypothetical protein